MSQSKRIKVENCIIHKSNNTSDKFVSLRNIRGDPHEKLQFLQKICRKRMSQLFGSAARMKKICEQIPDNLGGKSLDEVGYHQQCYKNFTRNVERLHPSDEAPATSSGKSILSPRNSLPLRSKSRQLFPPECLFCDKLQKRRNNKRENCQNFPVFKSDQRRLKEASWKLIESRAAEMDFTRSVRKIGGKDLFAGEANYHKMCFNDFNMKYASYWNAKKKTATFSQSDSDGHAQAFAKVMEMLSRQVLPEQGIVKLSDLRLAYVSELQIQGVPNSNYRGENLKAKIENSKYQASVGFSQITVSGCIVDYLLYDNRLSISDAITTSYRLGCAYELNPHRAAASIHDNIVE